MFGNLKIAVAFVLFVVLSGSYLSPLNSARRASGGSPTGFHETDRTYRMGYEEEALGENRYEIEYRINGLTSRERVRLYIQKRAAQIGQSIGASHFSLQVGDQDYNCYRRNNFLSVSSELEAIATFGSHESLSGSVFSVDETLTRVETDLAAINETKHDLQMIYAANYVTCDTGELHEPDEMIEYLTNAPRQEGASFTGRNSMGKRR